MSKGSFKRFPTQVHFVLALTFPPCHIVAEDLKSPIVLESYYVVCKSLLVH